MNYFDELNGLLNAMCYLCWNVRSVSWQRTDRWSEFASSADQWSWRSADLYTTAVPSFKPLIARHTSRQLLGVFDRWREKIKESLKQNFLRGVDKCNATASVICVELPRASPALPLAGRMFSKYKRVELFKPTLCLTASERLSTMLLLKNNLDGVTMSGAYLSSPLFVGGEPP